MTMERTADVWTNHSPEQVHSARLQSAIEIVEFGLEQSRRGGYAEDKIEGRSVGFWLATTLWKLGLELDEVRYMIEKYAPQENAPVVASTPLRYDVIPDLDGQRRAAGERASDYED